MKKVVLISVETVALNSLGEHSCIGVQNSAGLKSIAAQVKPGIYMIFSLDNETGLNRKDQMEHIGTNVLAGYYLSKGDTVYVFDSSLEMMQWFIS